MKEGDVMRKERALELLSILGAATAALEEAKGNEGHAIILERLKDEGIEEEEMYKALEAAYKLIDEDEEMLIDNTFRMVLSYFIAAAVELYEAYQAGEVK
jgi:hypothetical protein